MTSKAFAVLAVVLMLACAAGAGITNESEAAVSHGSSSSPLWSLSLDGKDLQDESSKQYHVYVGAEVDIVSCGDEGGYDEFVYDIDSVTSGYGLSYDSSYGDYAYSGRVSGTVSKAGTISVGYSGYDGPSFSGTATIVAHDWSVGTASSPLSSLSVDAYDLHSSPAKDYYVYVGSPVSIVSCGDEGGYDEFVYNVVSVTSGYGLTCDSSYGDYAYSGKVSGTISKAGTIVVGLSGYNGPSFTDSITIHAVSKSTAVTGVALSQTSASLTVGGTLALTATVSPSDASNKAVTWRSSDRTVATVSSSGVVTAKAAGTCTITATTSDGGKTATCAVTVASSTVSVTGVSVGVTELSLAKGTSGSVSCTVSPSNATNKSVTWSSSDTSVATVSSSGLITAKAAGTCTVTVKTVDGNKTATVNVTVTETTHRVTVKVGAYDSFKVYSPSSLAGTYTSDRTFDVTAGDKVDIDWIKDPVVSEYPSYTVTTTYKPCGSESTGSGVWSDGGVPTSNCTLTPSVATPAIESTSTEYRYTLSYDGNGATSGTVPATQSGSGSPETHTFTVASKGDLKRTGYTFKGWSESPSAASASYAPGSSYTMTYGSKTLYAVWERNTLTVSSTPDPYAVVGSQWTYAPSLNVTKYTMSVVGASWLSPVSKTVTGTPDAPGVYDVTITFTKSGYQKAEQSFQLTVLSALSFESSPTGGAIIYAV